MSILVDKNKAYLVKKSDHCGNKQCGIRKVIYTKNPDGTITIEPDFKALWEAFYNLDPYTPKPMCSTEAYTFPSSSTILSGTKDNLTDYVNFKRISPQLNEGVENSSITNEGTALRPYYSGYGKSLKFRFSYKISGDPNPNPTVNVYILFRNTAWPGRIVLFVDDDGNLSTYKGSSNSFTTGDNFLTYFGYTGPGVMTLKVKALPPEDVSCRPKPKCLEIADCRSMYTSCLYTIKETLGMYQRVPAPKWADIAYLVQQTIILTSKPIPPAAITGTPPNLITLVGADDINGNIFFRPNPGTPGDSGTILYSHLEHLWNQ